jgi:hypothetical protein
MVILLMVDSFGGPRGSEKLAQSLFELNVQVCQVSCGDDVKSTLTDFAAKNIGQEIGSWQKTEYMS